MLEGLNDEQRLAVTTPGHVLLTACPGSGKTRVLTFRVAHELEKLRYKKIVAALTFNNRAADEIKRRVDQLDMDSGKLWAGTIHAFCLEWILHLYCGYIPEIQNGVIIADEYCVEELLNEIKTEFGCSRYQKLSTRINPDGSNFETDESLYDLIDAYREKLRAGKLIDFDQLLYLSYRVLNDYPKIAKTINSLFQLICVDEYQDTQELQYKILSKIICANPNQTSIFFVGDRDQAIYGSLGGVAKSLKEIIQEFNGISITELELSGNYHSTQRSIDYYRHFQTEHIEIESRAAYSAEQGRICFNNAVHYQDIGTSIARIIQQALDEGIPEKEICVLAPQWWLVIPMGRLLRQLLPDVNLDAVGLSPLVRNKENIWFKFARLFLVEPAPNMYFVRSRWANELLVELDLLAVPIFSDMDRRGKKLLKCINGIKSDETEGIEYLEACFVMLLSELDITIELHPTLQIHWKYFFEGTRAKLDDTKSNYSSDLPSFKRLFRHNNGVVVNTCHGIKGEEFQTVICFGLLNGFIPNKGEADPEYAANKLLYVICSRAKKNLYLFAEQGHKKNTVVTQQLSAVAYTYDGF